MMAPQDTHVLTCGMLLDKVKKRLCVLIKDLEMTRLPWIICASLTCNHTYLCKGKAEGGLMQMQRFE